MHSLPGGKFAPPPPVSRIVVGGAAFLITGLFCFAWAGAATLHKLTTKEAARAIVGQLLVEPTANALAEAAKADPNAKTYVGGSDLVDVNIDRNAAQDINIAAVIADRRAAQLWENGVPKDPGPDRTDVDLPRTVVNLFTKQRHAQVGAAMMASLFGIGAGMLICALMATGAARFGLPGACALLGYVILRYHIRLLDFWFTKNGEFWKSNRARLQDAVFDPQRKLLFVTIALLAAGAVYSALLGGTKAVVKERRAAERRKEAAKKAKRAKRKAERQAGGDDAPPAPAEAAAEPAAEVGD